ncbi:MAG: hypothetical protein CL527_11035 [Aequorivita sp.]|uniref:Membrane protein n=1 Tax=Aequorivita vladivostokensis TaxID=171194 RepID=A0ABR5DGE0_9FLAO|nr:hypothetical protein [Aequorivita vladivostokensis]MAO49072.1 hypothetical protein [Aequorivita sp.]KJJ37866.1 membrane protein [Aequorivita vladivostokensis]MAO49199.1 hypothetical protein [Aequorivita sp.]MBF31161.1 hypothetical protein [Aequorivita sp.]HAV53920.1 hypothetical protein [Aequorivita sp.]
MNILNRYKSPTPKFFRTLRNVGLGLATAGGTLLAAPVALPAWLLSAATYVVVAGTVATAVSQATVQGEDPEPPHAPNGGL